MLGGLSLTYWVKYGLFTQIPYQILFPMKTPEHWRTSHDPCCKVPSPQSPFATQTETQTDTQKDGTDSITSTADAGGNEYYLTWTGIVTNDRLIIHRETWLFSFMWQIYFQSNLNLFSAGSSIQGLIQCMIVCSGPLFILLRARGAGSPMNRQTSKPRRDTVR